MATLLREPRRIRRQKMAIDDHLAELDGDGDYFELALSALETRFDLRLKGQQALIMWLLTTTGGAFIAAAMAIIVGALPS